VDVARLAERLLAEDGAAHALDVAEEVLADAGLRVERDREHQALRAVRGSPGLALSGHVDLVPVSDAWTKPAFGNRFGDGRLYGRGASDMRGPVAAMLAALTRTEAPAAIVLTSDEETTMDTVRAYVDEEALPHPDLLVVGDPTEDDVAVAGKGLLWVRVEAEGARGHASRSRPADRGPSAPERLVEALSGLEPEPLAIEHPRVGGATLAVSGLDSDPTPFNVLAGEAEARLDLRFPPPKTPSDVERALRSRLAMPREGLELSFEKREPAFLGDEEAGKRAREVLAGAGLEAELVGVDYVSEAGHWQRFADTLVLGPGSIDRAHGPDEYIEREELAAGAEAYAALIEAWGNDAGQA
jgi:acetylornithine deacetylase/succinyl-diaminopimelate desuccinylase-like protein